MVRAILLIFVGVGCAINGVLTYGKEPSAIGKTGWAFRQFGPNDHLYA